MDIFLFNEMQDDNIFKEYRYPQHYVFVYLTGFVPASFSTLGAPCRPFGF